MIFTPLVNTLPVSNNWYRTCQFCVINVRYVHALPSGPSALAQQTLKSFLFYSGIQKERPARNGGA